MCNYRECLEGITFTPEDSSIQVGYGYIDGRRFSAIVRDSRYEGTEHMHFPAEEFNRFAQAVSGESYGGTYAARDAQARQVRSGFLRRR